MSLRQLGLTLVAVGLLGSTAFGAPAQAEQFTGLTSDADGSAIFTFESTSPNTISALKPITGLPAGESLDAMDRNPVDGRLYAFSATPGRMVLIDESSGAATQVGPDFSFVPGSGFWDMDFDPTRNGEARIVGSNDQNLRWNPTTGAVTEDTGLDYPDGDPHAPSNPFIVGLAYSAAGTAYAYDYSLDAVSRLGAEDTDGSDGQLHTLGTSGVQAQSQNIGLDIGANRVVYAMVRTLSGGSASRLYLFEDLPPAGTATPAGGSDASAVIGDGSLDVVDIAAETDTNLVSLDAASYTMNETGGKVTVTITRSQTRGRVQVSLLGQDGTATDEDFDFVNETLIFEPGEASKTVDLTTRRDAIPEGEETFTVFLSRAFGSHVGFVSPSSATVHIVDDDTAPPPSVQITALTTSNGLVTLDSATPGNVSAVLPVTGLVAGEKLVAIDRRSATGRLYGMTDQSRLYVIDDATGAASLIGAGPFSPALSGTAWGFDFDPVADRIRVVSDDRQNLVLNPDDAAAQAEAPLAYAAGDPSAGTGFLPRLVGLAYEGNIPGATTTTAFGYDNNFDAVVRLGSVGGAPTRPDSGQLFTVGPSHLISEGEDQMGLDIAPDGTAWALYLDAASDTPTRLSLVDLGTGTFSPVGDLSDTYDVYSDIAVEPVRNVLQLSGGSVEVGEAAGVATVTVTRDQSLGAASVDYATSDGSAVAGSDYTATSGTLTFAAGETSKTVTAPIADDSAVESPESLTFTLSNPKGGVASLGGTSSATISIADNDTAQQQPPPDTTKPVVSTCHKGKQKLRKQKAVRICVRSSEDGSASAVGKLTVRGVKRVVKLKRVSGAVKAGVKRTFALKLSAKVRARLRKHPKATAAVTIRVRDAAGNETKLARAVKARR